MVTRRTPRKTKSASKVLRLMDRDVSYGAAVRAVVKSDKISKAKLERQLNPFI
jgi:hypothetical protein